MSSNTESTNTSMKPFSYYNDDLNSIYKALNEYLIENPEAASNNQALSSIVGNVADSGAAGIFGSIKLADPLTSS